MKRAQEKKLDTVEMKMISWMSGLTKTDKVSRLLEKQQK